MPSDQEERALGAVQPSPEPEEMPTYKTGFFAGHPLPLPILFFSEMWERFSFYGMRALLMLYMLEVLRYDQPHAYTIYGAYGSLVYATPILGGIIADRLLGNRAAIVMGGLFMALGQFALAIPGQASFYTGLALLILGNGLFKPNVSSLVGKCYRPGDSRRDAGFTIFYMGINLGAFIAPIACGFVKVHYGFNVGFALAGVGMLLGLGVFLWGSSTFGERGAPPNPSLYHAGLGGVLLACVLGVPLIVRLMQIEWLRESLIPGISAVMLLYIFATAMASKSQERNRLLALIILFCFSVVFWAFFEQAGSSLTVFTDKCVNRLGVDASMFQSVNAIFIVLLAPLFSALWVSLNRSRQEPSTPAKFSLGLLQVGLGFGALVLGAQMAGTSAQVNVMFLLLAYLLHTTGELCLSPVGLSTVTKLAPERMMAFVMGFWFLSSSLAHWVAGKVAASTAVPEGASAAATLAAFSGAFGNVALVSVGVAVLAAALTPLIRKLMDGVH